MLKNFLSKLLLAFSPAGTRSFNEWWSSTEEHEKWCYAVAILWMIIAAGLVLYVVVHNVFTSLMLTLIVGGACLAVFIVKTALDALSKLKD